MLKLKTLIKEGSKNKLLLTVLVLVLGVAVMAGIKLMPEQKQSPAPATTVQAQAERAADDYETRLEKRLEEVLSKAAGAGRVKVMVTLAEGEHTIVERNEVWSDQNTDEVDSAGGTRRQSQSSTDSKAVMVRSADGSESPLVAYEERPKIEGVIIIAEGGGDVAVKDALMRAAQTVLGVELHKVTVLKGSF